MTKSVLFVVWQKNIALLDESAGVKGAKRGREWYPLHFFHYNRMIHYRIQTNEKNVTIVITLHSNVRVCDFLLFSLLVYVCVVRNQRQHWHVHVCVRKWFWQLNNTLVLLTHNRSEWQSNIQKSNMEECWFVYTVHGYVHLLSFYAKLHDNKGFHCIWTFYHLSE